MSRPDWLVEEDSGELYGQFFVVSDPTPQESPVWEDHLWQTADRSVQVFVFHDGAPANREFAEKSATRIATLLAVMDAEDPPQEQDK